MQKKWISFLLVLVLSLGLLPTPVFAAETKKPDWNFLVIFAPMDADYKENGQTKHIKTSLTKEERTTLIKQLVEFESTMIESGVMTPHFQKYAISAPITKLIESSYGPYPRIEDIASYLEEQDIDLDEYDHVIVYARMDGIDLGYGGITPAKSFDNGTTYSFLPADYCLRDWGSTPKRPAYLILHEFLHTMERTCGESFDLHAIEDDMVPGYQTDEKYKACMMDILLNRVTGDHGSGVRPSAWSCSLRVLQTLQELTIPDDMTEISSYQFQHCTNLERVVVHSKVTAIKDHAFQFCSGLSEVTLPSDISSIEEGTFEQCTALTEITVPSGVTSIGAWAFESCTSLKKITIPVSVVSIGAAAFQKSGLTDVYYQGTQKQWKAIQIGGTTSNSPLTNATIHYNSAMPDASSNQR